MSAVVGLPRLSSSQWQLVCGALTKCVATLSRAHEAMNRPEVAAEERAAQEWGWVLEAEISRLSELLQLARRVSRR